MKLSEYLQDGAHYQARAVLSYLQPLSEIEESWDGDHYRAEIEIGRWENCREQGYIASLRSAFESQHNRQLNIAFFEHRNSDSICAVKWEQKSINSLTIDTAKFPDDVYKDKYDTSHSTGVGQAAEMAEWIAEQFRLFWIETAPQKSHG